MINRVLTVAQDAGLRKSSFAVKTGETDKKEGDRPIPLVFVILYAALKKPLTLFMPALQEA